MEKYKSKIVLNRLKIQRYAQMNIRYNLNFIQKLIYRAKQLKNDHSYITVITYFYSRLFHKLLITMKALSTYFSIKIKFTNNTKKISLKTKPIYSILITGGLGDAIVIARAIRDLQNELKYDFNFDVFFHSPKLAKLFFSNIKGFREVINNNIFNNVKQHYTFSLIANQFITFINEEIDHKTLIKYYPKIEQIFSNIENFRKKERLDDFIKSHPFLDGAFADIQSRLGRKRYSFLHNMIGIEYSGHKLNIASNKNILKKYNLTHKKYITVHDGWDEHFRFISNRPTKSIPINMWLQIINKLRKKYPNCVIVQIGGKKGCDLKGVDINLRDQLKFDDSISILSSSKLHIDSESGLVHLACALGIKSIVFFGPTNLPWFSYPENINISPNECGNCWWSTDNWMNECPLGLNVPACTQYSNIENLF